MGTTNSKHEDESLELKQRFHEIFYEFSKNGHFNIFGRATKIGPCLFIIGWMQPEQKMYEYHIYYQESDEIMKCILMFTTHRKLRKKCFISFHKFPILRIIFQLDSSNSDDSSDSDEISFVLDFSKCFDEQSDFGNELNSLPVLLPQGLKMILLDDSNRNGPHFFYYTLKNGKKWDFYIVSSLNIQSNSSGFGAEKCFENGDNIFMKYTFYSNDQLPFISRNSNDELVIRCKNDGIDTEIKINLPDYKETSTSKTIFEIQEWMSPSEGKLMSMPGFKPQTEEPMNASSFVFNLSLLEDTKEIDAMSYFRSLMKTDQKTDEDEGISDFGHSRKEEEVTSCHQSIFFGDEIPDENEMTMRAFLAHEEIDFSNRPSVADVSRSALIFTKEGSLGGLTSCVSQENDNGLFAL